MPTISKKYFLLLLMVLAGARTMFGTPPDKPLISFSGPLDFCVGGSVTFSTAAVAGLNYQWYKNAVPVSGGTNPSLTVNSTGVFALRVTNVQNEIRDSDPIWTHVTALEPILSTADQLVCGGGSTVLEAQTGFAYFDGGDDVVKIPDFTWKANTGAVTIELWIKVNPEEVRQGVTFSIGGNDQQRLMASIPWSGNMIGWDYGNAYGTAEGRLTANFQPYLGAWTHVALVSAGSGGNFMGIYLNGNLVSSSSVSDGNTVDLNGFYLGNYFGNFPFQGAIKEFRIWNKVRTAQEIQTMMHKIVDPNSTDLMGYWPLNNLENSMLKDLSPGQHDGKVFNGVAVQSSALAFNWAPSSGLNTIVGKEVTASPALSANYQITSMQGCFSSTESKVIIDATRPAPIVQILTQPDKFCQGTALQTNEGSGYTYQWKRKNLNIKNATSNLYIPDLPGGFKVSVAKDGCSQTSNEVNLNFVSLEPIITTPDVSACLDLDVPLSARTGFATFHGINESIQIPQFIFQGNKGVTVECWIKIASAEVGETIAFAVGNNDGQRLMATIPWSDNVMTFYYGNPYGSAPGRLSANFKPYLNKWTHVALVSAGAGGNFKAIYLDGDLVASENLSDGNTVNLNGVALGNYAGNYFFKGSMKEFRIWDRVRTSAEIKTFMNKIVPSETIGLKGYWPLNAAPGGSVMDLSSGNNSGVVNNNVSFIQAATSFSWLPSSGAGNPNTSSTVGNSIIHTNYTVTVQLDNQCLASRTIVLGVSCNNKVYYFLEDKPSANTLQVKSELNFMIKESYTSGVLNYKIYDYQKQEVSGLLSLNKNYGENYFSLKLADIPNLTKGKTYLLEVTNEKQEKEFLRFVYQ